MNAGAFLHFEHVGKYEYHLQQPSKTVDIHIRKQLYQKSMQPHIYL